jgi:hypothetical protein
MCFGRSNHLSAATDDHVTYLVGAAAIKRNAMLFWVLIGRSHLDGYGVTESNGLRELQRLSEIDCARPWEFRAE